MKYINYELKKLLGIKYLWIFLAALLIINGGIAFYTAHSAGKGGGSIEKFDDFFELYFENTAELEEYYTEMQAWQTEQMQLWAEAMRSGDDDYEPEPWQDRYASDESSDLLLFRTLYAAIDTAKNYPSNMQRVINSAKANLEELESMGISPDSYTYRYQVRIIEIYEHLRDNVSIGVEYIHGWGEYFRYDIVNIFIFIILILFATVIFAQEKANGFLPIIRAAPHGRTKTALAKIAVMGLLSVGIVLLFTLSTWAIFGIELGFSSASNAIQAFGDFTYCQYIVTVGEYFAITLAVRILTFWVFSAITLAISVYLYNYILTCAAGLGFFGLNFLLYTISYLNAGNPLKNLNFIAAAAVTPLFSRFRSINFFSGVWGYVSFMLTVFGVLIFAGVAAAVLVFVRRGAGSSGRLGKFAERAAGLIRRLRHSGRRGVEAKTDKVSVRAKNRRRARVYSHNLIFYEAFKTLVSSRFLLIILVLLCAKIYFFSSEYDAKGSFTDAIYKEYMTTLEGELTDEKLQYIAEERAFISSALSKQDAMRNDYINERITADEYREYLSDYNYANSRNEIFGIIESHAAYLKHIEQETGVRAWFLYDTGYKKLTGTGADFYLFAAILLLFAGTFADEYSSRSSSGSFAQLLRTTKKGRKQTFFSKLASMCIITLLTSLVYNAVELFIILKNYSTPGLTAPILSIEKFGSIGAGASAGMSALQYLILMYALRTVAALLLALFVTAISELLRRVLPVMGVVVAIALLPALVEYFGLSAAGKVNFLNFFGGTNLFLNSAVSDTLGSDMGALILFITICAAICAAMLIRAHLTYTKR